MPVQLLSKAQTLVSLYQKLNNSKVLDIYCFTVESFQNGLIDYTVEQIMEKFGGNKIIIRSSAHNEDGIENSNAGHFKSIPNVNSMSKDDVEAAINEVISSYDTQHPFNEVFVQQMLSDIAISGVAFTADIDTLTPYYIINFDESGETDSVTSGNSGSFKTFVQLKGGAVSPLHPLMEKLIISFTEIEVFFGNDKLDIEFSVSNENEIYIFQVRPISTQNKEDFSSINIKDALYKVYRKIEKLNGVHPNLLGSKTVFGVMPDWNPAEIIGLKPRQLSLSLYKELITDNIWAFQRDNYGYRNLRSHPLMISFLGIPFIDVRVDFNSFIPKDLNEEIASKLAEYYLDKLIKTPSYHDKIEFEIVHSCFYFNLHNRLNELIDFGFSKSEISQIETSLLKLTNNIIDPNDGLYMLDLQKVEILKSKYESVLKSNLGLIDKIYWLIEDCKRYGTLPFAGVARAAFIATQFLNSMVEVGILSKKDYSDFVFSLQTVASQINDDLESFHKGNVSQEEFLGQYGHLRPGTYDILSKRYDENFENYFSTITSSSEYCHEFILSENQKQLVQKYLVENGVNISPEQLFEFIRKAIEGREYSKWVFTKSLSKVLQLVEELGTKVGISREDMADTDIKVIMNLYAVLDHRSVFEILTEDISKNQEFYKFTRAVKLPSIITKAEDIYGFYLLNEEPNFVTQKTVQSEIVLENELTINNLQGKIILIKSADPGFDFLFTKKIAGLITQFGGANSHMAVRCAELGIPAVIGAGEKNFKNWKNANILDIDCLNKQVKVIS